MFTKSKRMLLVFGLVFIIAAAPVGADNPKVNFSNYAFNFILEVYNAVYEDSDNDGFKDDVHAHFGLKVVCKETEKIWYRFYDDEKYCHEGEFKDINVVFNIKLVLTSGLTFTHEISWKMKDNYKYFELTLYNQAIEEGWYDLYLNMETYDGGSAHGTAWLTFDPPGGGGGLPYAILK